MQVMSIIFSSLRTYFSPLVLPVIDQGDTFYDPSHLIHGLRISHTHWAAAAALLLLLLS